MTCLQRSAQLTLPCVSDCAQITQREFQLTEDFIAPKGALLMPSLIASSMQVSLQGLPPHAVSRHTCKHSSDWQQ